MFYCNAWKLYVYRGGLQCCQDVTDYFLLSNLLNCFLRRGCMHSCVQHAALSSRCTLKPVHTSNNVEATFDFVEATFDFVAKHGNNVERVFGDISSIRQSQKKLNMFNLFPLRRKDEISFDIVVKNGNDVEATFDFVEATFDFVERIVRQRCFDIVAGVDGALVFTVTAKFVRVFQR